PESGPGPAGRNDSPERHGGRMTVFPCDVVAHDSPPMEGGRRATPEQTATRPQRADRSRGRRISPNLSLTPSRRESSCRAVPPFTWFCPDSSLPLKEIRSPPCHTGVGGPWNDTLCGESKCSRMCREGSHDARMRAHSGAIEQSYHAG